MPEDKSLTGLSDTEMFKIILEEIRGIHARINALVKEHHDARIQDAEKFSEIREKQAVSKVKIGAMIAGVSVVVASVVTWIVNLVLE